MSGSRLAVVAGLVAWAAWPAPALAGKRTYSVNGSGACLYWASRSVTYRINPTRGGTSPSCGPRSATDAGAAAAVEAGFSAWTGAQESCTDLSLARGADTSEQRVGYDQSGSNENLVVFRTGWCSENAAAKADPCWTDPTVRCSDTYGCFENTGSLAGNGIIALTTTTYVPATGEIVDADMELVDWTGTAGSFGSSSRVQGWYFTCVDPATTSGQCTQYGETDCYGMDLQNTATHEAGHFIGFAHTASASSTMYASAAVGEISKRSLAPGDLHADTEGPGLCDVYPAGGATLTCVQAASSSHGCGSAGGAGLLSLVPLLALVAVRRGHRTTTAA